MKTELTVLVICAVIIGLQGFLGGKEAYEYVNPYLLFWLKFAFAGLGAGALVAKAFMSRTYGDDADKKEAKKIQEAGGSDTVIISKSTQTTESVSPAPPAEPITPTKP